MACAGVWLGAALSDATLEGMVSSITSWEAQSPTCLWLLDQASTATAVLDRIASADQIAITGTTAAAESGLAFEVGVYTAPLSLRVVQSSLRF